MLQVTTNENDDILPHERLSADERKVCPHKPPMWTLLGDILLPTRHPFLRRARLNDRECVTVREDMF